MSQGILPSLCQLLQIMPMGLCLQHGLFISRVKRCLVQPSTTLTFLWGQMMTCIHRTMSFSHLHVAIPPSQPNSVNNVHVHWPPCNSHNMLPIVFQGRLELIKYICGDGMWHIDQCPPSYTIQCRTTLCNIKWDSFWQKHKKVDSNFL